MHPLLDRMQHLRFEPFPGLAMAVQFRPPFGFLFIFLPYMTCKNNPEFCFMYTIIPSGFACLQLQYMK